MSAATDVEAKRRNKIHESRGSHFSRPQFEHAYNDILEKIVWMSRLICHLQAAASEGVSGLDPREVEERRRAFSVSDGSRPFLAAVFETMECAENDYLALFALCLIYSMQNNSGERVFLLESSLQRGIELQFSQNKVSFQIRHFNYNFSGFHLNFK